MARIAVTGASGFVGQNLVLALKARTDHEVIEVSRSTILEPENPILADHIIHLAGVNRPPVEAAFENGNVDYAKEVLSCVHPASSSAQFHYASSTRVTRDDAYGRSKKVGEELVRNLAPPNGWTPVIWRLPNLFGKWCRPHYNSFVATFIAQAIRGEQLSIDNPASPVELLYIDDLVEMFLQAVDPRQESTEGDIDTFPVTQSTVGQVAELLVEFNRNRDATYLPKVGNKFAMQLHATFQSYLDQDARVFALGRFASDTGSFCELFKGGHFGQVSALVIEPGERRGNHFHDTKVENFHLALGSVDLIEYDVRGGEILTRRIETGESFWTRPGWVHTLANIGDMPAVLVIWANEIFDHDRPDTFGAIETK